MHGNLSAVNKFCSTMQTNNSICCRGHCLVFHVVLTMLSFTIFLALFSTYATQNICGYGCLCFENILECSNLGFTKFPEFAEMVKLTTEKLMLRNIPQLDLSAFKTSIWINLKEIYLKGNSFYFISFFFIYEHHIKLIDIMTSISHDKFHTKMLHLNKF